MAPGRNKSKKSPVHRLSLTHGQEGVPKFIRENTAQFFAAATRRESQIASASRRESKIESVSRPTSSTELQQKQNIKNNDDDDDEKNPNLFTKSTPKPLTPITVLPPIRTRTPSSKRPKAISSASVCIHQRTLSPFIQSPTNSLESTTLQIESPKPLPPIKRQFRPVGPVDQDIFRKAYERALSVARSRLLFRDPYSLTRASATHGVLYSYYDHTPMCVFSRGTACNHRQDKTTRQERKTKANVLRKKIFHDVNVENYIR